MSFLIRHRKEHTMLDITQLSKVLHRLFAKDSYGKNLEHYIVQRNPKTPADIEHFTQEYERKQERSTLWL